MSLIYKAENKVTYVVYVKTDDGQVIVDVEGNVGKFGVDEPLFSWEGSTEEFVRMLSDDIIRKDTNEEGNSN